MTRLNDTQLTILASAAQRSHRAVFFPDGTSDDARAKLAKALLRKALIEEAPTKGRMPIHRLGKDGQKISLIITDAGLAAIGVTDVPAPGDYPVQRRAAQGSTKAEATRGRGPKAGAAAAASKDRVEGGTSAHRRKPSRRSHAALPPAQPDGNAPRVGSKLATIIALLGRADGADIGELMEVTGWLPHTTRAALTGLRKRGFAVTRDRSEAGTSIYRILDRDARAEAA